MIKKITKSNKINSTIRIAGDKSISHRAAILNSMAHGIAEVTNFCVGDDQESVIRCLRTLGTKIIHNVNYADDYPIHQISKPVSEVGSERNFYDRYFFNGYSKTDDKYHFEYQA